jgi:two-component system sensor histidine kinase UhpB
MDSPVDSMLLVNPDGIILDTNQTFAQRIGRRIDELIGRCVYDFLPPELAKSRRARVDEIVHFGVPVRFEDERAGMQLDQSARPICDAQGKVIRIAIVARDITDRKRLEEKLQQSESLLKEAQHVASIGHWELDTAIGTPTWSEEIFHIFGLDPAQGEPSFKAHENIVHFDDWHILNNAITKASTEGIPFDIEFRLLRPDKSIRWMNAKGYATRNSEGCIVRLFGTAQDINERKRAEKERDQLFEQVRASRERLRNLSRRLVEVQEVERHDLVRKLHDEVGQSLTALSINLNIVHSQLPPETAIKTATRIDDSLKLVEETVERIRDVMVELRPPVLDDYGVSATLHWYGKQFSERTGIPAVLKVEELKPRLPLPEETALFRIAQEALTNVAKYAQAKNVTVGLKEFDKVIYLTIADDGVGFDPTAHHQPGARPEWGLINMRERAQTVGGTLNTETAPGKGTRIIVEVPRNR